MSNQNGFDSDEQEAYEYERYMRGQEQNHDVVPCYKCGNPMYQETEDPRMNYCEKCWPKEPAPLHQTERGGE